MALRVGRHGSVRPPLNRSLGANIDDEGDQFTRTRRDSWRVATIRLRRSGTTSVGGLRSLRYRNKYPVSERLDATCDKFDYVVRRSTPTNSTGAGRRLG